MNRIILLISLLLSLSSVRLLAQKRAKKPTNLPSELPQLMTLFAGEFDNFEQVHKEKEDKVAEIHEHIHSIFAPVSLPAFGANVLYVKQYMDGNTKKIYRQRLYNFVDDAAEGAVRLDIYSFAVDSLYDDAHLKPEKLANVTPATLTNTPGCAVYWKKTDDKFIGYMKDKACNFVSKRSGKRVFITDSLLLNSNQLWIRDEATDEDGKYVFGHKGHIPHKLKRCHFYKGWFALEKAGLPDDYESTHDLMLHDQGGRQRLMTKDGKPMKYTLELAHVVYGKDQTVLKLALYEEGNPKAIDYTWTSPGAGLIGINMRWFSAGMTRVKE